MKLKYCLTGILCIYLKCFSQEIKPLTIGDKVPDALIKNIYNYPALQSKFPAFKNELIILDFMATTCLGCIHILPHLDSLQKEYGNKVRIILISYEKKERVGTFLQKNIIGREIHLPIVTNDTLLSKYFPHTLLSHEVWIKDNVVKAITKSSYVKRENIEAVLTNKAINWPVKNDMPLYDYSKSLLAAGQQKDLNSIITPFIKDASYKHSMIIDTIGKSVRTRMFNLPVVQMYLRTYGLDVFLPSFIILDVADTKHFIYDKNDKDWRKQNTYCYENFLPLRMDKKTRAEKMRSDLDNYLGLHSSIERRKILCNVITRNNVPATFVAHNYSLHAIVSSLNSRYNSIPFLNESGYNGEIFLDPSINILTEENKVREILMKQGFNIMQATREVTVFVIREK